MFERNYEKIKNELDKIKQQIGRSEELDLPSLYFGTIFSDYKPSINSKLIAQKKSIDEIEKRMELLLEYLKIEYVKETESTDDGTNVKEGFRKALKKKKIEKGFLCCDES